MYKRTQFITVITVVSLILIAFFNLPAIAQDDVVEWKMQDEFFEADTAYQITTKMVAKLIEEGSGGKVRVNTYPSGAIAGPEEMLRATMRGAIEVSQSMAAGPAMLIPESWLLVPPGAISSLAQQYDLIYRQGLLELLREAYKEQGLYFLCPGMYGPLVTMTNFNVNNWKDFKGKKGWADPLTADMITEISGAVSVPVPGWDMYSAMKLGNIDWFQWTLAELESTKLKEVVKYVVIEPRIYLPNTAIYVNLKAWNKLGPELQNSINDYIEKNIIEVGFRYRDVEEDACQKAQAYGVKFIKMEKSEADKYYDACSKVWDNIAKMSPRCAKGIDIIRNFSKRMIDY